MRVFVAILVIYFWCSVTLSNGYEVLEGKYKGEVYRPARHYASRQLNYRSHGGPRRRHHHHPTPTESRSFRDDASASSSRGMSRAMGSSSRSLSGIFSSLIQQLSTALHRRISGPQMDQQVQEKEIPKESPIERSSSSDIQEPATQVVKTSKSGRNYGTNDRRVSIEYLTNKSLIHPS